MTTEKTKTILDDNKFKLTAKPIESGARPPTFQLGTYLNNPQFIVYPNHDNGSGVTWISAGMDVNTFGLVLQTLEHLATNAANGEQVEIENKKDIPKEKRSDPKVTKVVATKTQLGRDDEGRIWISVLDNVKPNAPKIRFYFNVNYYHSFRSKNGLSAGQISQMQCLAWVSNAKAFMHGILLNNPNAAIDAANAKSKWGGGNSNKGGNNNSYQKNNNGGAKATSGDGFGEDDGGWDE